MMLIIMLATLVIFLLVLFALLGVWTLEYPMGKLNRILNTLPLWKRHG